MWDEGLANLDKATIVLVRYMHTGARAMQLAQAESHAAGARGFYFNFCFFDFDVCFCDAFCCGSSGGYCFRF